MHIGASGDGQAGSQVGGNFSCPAGGLRSQQQDARKDRRDRAPLRLRRNNGHSSTGEFFPKKRGKASRARGWGQD